MLVIDLPDGSAATLSTAVAGPPTIAAKYTKSSVTSGGTSIVALQYSGRGFGRLFSEELHRTKLRDSVQVDEFTVLIYDGSHLDGTPITVRVIQAGQFDAVDRFPAGVSTKQIIENVLALKIAAAPHGLRLDRPDCSVTWKAMLTTESGIGVRLRPSTRMGVGLPHGVGHIYRITRDISPSTSEQAMGIPTPKTARMVQLVFEANGLSATHIPIPANGSIQESDESSFVDWTKSLNVFECK
jgi:hypothetical protein